MPLLDVLDSRMVRRRARSTPFRPQRLARPMRALHAAAPDPAGAIWQDGAFRRDTWAKVDVTSALPDGAVIVPKKRWLAERDQLAGRNTPLGLLVSAGETVDDIAGDLSRFAIIALDFPKFSDGRAYSTARLLREKHRIRRGAARRRQRARRPDSPDAPRRLRYVRGDERADPPRPDRRPPRRSDAPLPAGGAVEPPAGTRPWLRRTPDVD